MPVAQHLKAEMKRRLEAIRAAMGRDRIDSLIIYGTTGVGTPMNGNYTYASHHVPIYAASLMLLPRAGAPVLFVPGENQHLEARATGWVDDVRLSSNPVADICRHLTSADTARTIAVSSLAALPAVATETLRSRLDGAALVEGSGLIFDCRTSKAGYERDMLRRATAIADDGFARSLEVLAPGISELDWKAEAERVMTAAGADGGFHMLSAGRPRAGPDAFTGYVVSPTERRIRAGDLALLEISPRFAGYYSQIVRLVSFGAPPQDIVRAHDACIGAKNTALAALVPDAPFADVAHAMQTAIVGAGFTMKDIACAHTIGLDLSEQVITLKSPGAVTAGMVVTVHPMIALSDGRQMFVGDTVLVGASGVERLGAVSDDIAVIA